MFGFRKKAPLSKENKQDKLKDVVERELQKEQERKRKKAEQGASYVSIVLLFLTVLAGVIFWMYGKLTSTGLVGLGSDLPKVENFGQGEVIIFEK